MANLKNPVCGMDLDPAKPAAQGEHIDNPAAGLTCGHKLPTGEEETLELLPDTPGEYGFSCQMGMFRGRLVLE